MRRAGITSSLIVSLLIGVLGIPSASASIEELLRCSSKIIYARKGGFSTLQTLSSMFENTLKMNVSEHEIENYSTQCNILERTLRHNPSEARTLYLARISQLQSSPYIRRLFAGFAKPTYTCSSVTSNIGGTLYFMGFSSGIGFAYCESSMGNTWLEARPFSEITMGGGLDISVGMLFGVDKDHSYSRSPVKILSRYSLNASGILGMQFVGHKFSDIDSFGVSVGYGGKASIGLGAELQITVIPLGTSYDSLLNSLMKATSL